MQAGRARSPSGKPQQFTLKDGTIIDTMIPYGTKANQYEIDRAMQKAGHYTGIWSIAMQDKAMIEGMTRTVDRSLEHLGSSDIAVIAARRRLLKLARDLEHGIEPVAADAPRAVPRPPAGPDLRQSPTSARCSSNTRTNPRSPSPHTDRSPGRYDHLRAMDYKVISADDHLDLRFFPADLWTARAPEKLKARVPHIEDVDGLPFWVCDGKRWGRWGQFKAEGPRQWALERGGVMNEGELRPTTPELRLQDMDRDGVDATVMYGPTDPFYTEDPDLRYELYRGYNDWVESFTQRLPRATDRRLANPS